MPVQLPNPGFTDINMDTWYGPFSLYAVFGCPGAAIQKFIQQNWNKWNVKNWVTLSTQTFDRQWRGKVFSCRYTLKDDLSESRVFKGKFNGFGDVKKYDDGDIAVSLKLDLSVDIGDWTKMQNIFGGGGNSFFLSGIVDAEKVEESDWYDVKKMEIDGLCFMDRLGRKEKVLPKS